MSFSGFGSNNNNNQQSTFGGFGSTNTGGGFGSSQTSQAGGSLFGGNTSTSGGFGSGGGFGASNNNSSPFGANKSTFGAPAATTSGGGLFGGGNTATSGGFGGSGGFGNTSNTSNTGGGFGSSASGGLFGQNKPATGGFGSNNTGGSIFGGGSGGANTGGGFGASTTQNNPFSGGGANPNANTGFGSQNTGGGGFTFGASSSNNAPTNNNGTAGTPFQAFSEKDGPSNQTSMYQSITFQGPYANKSFEELRAEDYAQGRRFGNTNGQAGSFGQSTGFGGFGGNTNTSSASGGMFGSNTATSGNTGFGGGSGSGGFGSTNTGGGFGAANNNAGGGLFGGQNKPATGGLFGGQQSTATTTGGFGSTANSGGGLFGNSGSGTGFGANSNTASTGGGLFGNNNQQQQNKPAFGGFGSNTSTGGGFGASTNTGGGLFGNSTNTSNNTNTGGGLFGQQNTQQQQQQSNPFGGSASTGGGLFGNQNKPAAGGLFGSTNNASSTGGGLFGAQNNQQQQSNPFGGSTNTGGGLFGNQNQNKPASTGLFGSTNTNTNTGGGLFGSQNNQQSNTGLFGASNTNNSGGGLFGNQNKPAGGGLFGSSNNGGSSLFGGNQNQQTNTGSLFGSNNNQNQQNSNSLFGGSLNQSNQQAAPQNQLHASLTSSPYGNEQLFSSLAAPSPPVGPLATPLNGARPAARKTPSLLASARLNTPVYSPRNGSFSRNGGYGFSYSTYGTPGSAYTSGSLTPGASSLLRPTGSLGSGLTSRLNKSLSTSNLRGDSVSSEGRSLLRPSAFSPEGTPGRYQSGSVRKLKIDRSLRTDLFAPEPKAIEAAKENEAPSLRKRVSFENEPKQTTALPSAQNALVRTEEEEGNESPGLIPRAPPGRSQAPEKRPEMEQVNGQLSTVPEDAETPRPTSAPQTKAPPEKARTGEVGSYWTKPALKDLKNMSRQQLKSVGNFTVGRQGVGRIEFGNVDLTNTPVDDIPGKIVMLKPRSATVYEDDNEKPSMGKGLNVPSTIYLEKSWPRSQGGKKAVSAKSGKEYDNHVRRLKRCRGTEFVNYDADTGIWSFKVQHFTTYGLDDDDEDMSEFPDDSRMQLESSGLSDPPETPAEQQDDTVQSMETPTGEVDDTFQFKLNQRSQLSVPGGFGDEGLSYDYDDQIADEGTDGDVQMMSGGLGDAAMDDPFVSSGGPVQAPSPGAVERFHSSMLEDEPEDEPEALEQEIPGSFAPEPKMPKSILKPSTAFQAFASPEKLATETWEEQLQRTMSPRKRDRQALKDMQQSFLRAREEEGTESPLLGQSLLGQSYLAQKSAKKAKAAHEASKNDFGKSQAFNTAMDLMNSMYEQDKTRRKNGVAGKGFEYPNSKKPRLSSDAAAQDAEWHDSLKPSFTNAAIFAYSASGSAPQVSGPLLPALSPLVGEHRDVRFAKFVPAEDISTKTSALQKENTIIAEADGFPIAHAPADVSFASFAESVESGLSIASHEKSIWELCSILHDPLHEACAEYMHGVPEDKIEEFAPRMRMDSFGAFWSRLVAPMVGQGLKRARTAEEKAILHLTKNDVVGACEVLMGAKDFKLATLVAQLPVPEGARQVMANQITNWRNRNDWSEMSEPVRALYSILAGEVCFVQGQSGSAENSASEIRIAETFGLEWQQSFALRLFFGGFQSIEDAIKAYIQDLESGRETVRPAARWETGSETADTAMEILRLYAAAADLGALLDPVAVSGSPFNTRLTWQFASILDANERCAISDATLDKLSYDFATELDIAGDLVSAAWILLHIRDSEARQRAVVGLLNRNGEKISEDTFASLVEDIQIPASLIWRAKALYAQAGLQDSATQCAWLLRAGDIDQAHAVLCSTLGPQAVIEQDFDRLSEVLGLFPNRSPEGWEVGGQVYTDFVRIVRASTQQKRTRDVFAAMQRLKRGLAGMEESGGSGKSLEERVAVIEMGRVLAETLREAGDAEEDQDMGGMKGVGMAKMVGDETWEKYRVAMGVVA